MSLLQEVLLEYYINLQEQLEKLDGAQFMLDFVGPDMTEEQRQELQTQLDNTRVFVELEMIGARVRLSRL